MYRANIGTFAQIMKRNQMEDTKHIKIANTITRCPMNGLQSFRWQYVTNPSCWYTATAK